jgi:hypothetical protein
MKAGELITLFMDWGNGLVIMDFKLLPKAKKRDDKVYYQLEAQCKSKFITRLTAEQLKASSKCEEITVKSVKL